MLKNTWNPFEISTTLKVGFWIIIIVSHGEGELEAEMHTVHVNIAGITETRRNLRVSDVLRDCVVFNSGLDHSCENDLDEKSKNTVI
jgi:hypothetical protein